MLDAVPRPGQGVRPAGKDVCNLRIGTLNVGTMSGRSNEIIEMLTRRKIDICCAQETRWRGGSARMVKGKDSRYKFLWCGNQSGFGGVGILIAEKYVENVISVERFDHRHMQLRLLVGKIVMNFVCAYAPQSGRPVEEKDSFFEKLLGVVARVPNDEFLMVCGDLNGHVGQGSNGFEGHHGGNGFGVRNQDGTRILDLCVATNLAITNTFYRKQDSRLITYCSGDNKSQIDYILVRRSDLKRVRDTKVIGSEECVTQHKLVVCDITLEAKQIKPRKVYS